MLHRKILFQKIKTNKDHHQQKEFKVTDLTTQWFEVSLGYVVPCLKTQKLKKHQMEDALDFKRWRNTDICCILIFVFDNLLSLKNIMKLIPPAFTFFKKC